MDNDQAQPTRINLHPTTPHEDQIQLCQCRHKPRKTLPGNPPRCHQCKCLQRKTNPPLPTHDSNNLCPTCHMSTTHHPSNICPNCTLYARLHNNNLQKRWPPTTTTHHDINPLYSTQLPTIPHLIPNIIDMVHDTCKQLKKQPFQLPKP